MRKIQDNGVDLQNLQNKFLLQGKSAMNDSDLLVLLLGNGKRSVRSRHLGDRVWQYCGGNLANLGRMSMEDMMQIEGLGAAGMLTLAAAMELGRRRVVEEPVVKQIKNPTDAFDMLLPLFIDSVVESFYVVYLNRANRILRLECVSVGGFSGTVVDIRLVYKRALELRATALVMSHNHPSGNLHPSEQDIKLTKQFIEAGKLLDVRVIDHVIIAGNRCYSFAEHGDLVF